MGGNINFGSRTEFLPGEGTNELDIKYQRYGGCFVTYKKGALYVLASVLFAAIVGFLVYHYYSCNKNDLNGNESIDEIVEEISKSARIEKQNDSEKLNLKSVISNNVNPLYYRLKIHPYLNDNSDKKFTFEGHVTIVFQITGSPTKTIILNAKNFDISDGDVSLTYSSTSLLEPQSASLVLEEDIDSSAPLESGSQVLETTISPIETTTVKKNLETIAPPEDFTTSSPLISDDDTFASTLPPTESPQNDAPSNDENAIDSNNDSKKEDEATTVIPEKTSKEEDAKKEDAKKEVTSTEEPPAKEINEAEPEMASSNEAPVSVTTPSTSSTSSSTSAEPSNSSNGTTPSSKEEEAPDAEPIPIETTTASSSPNGSSTTVSSTVVKVAEKNNVHTIKKKYNKHDGTYLLKTKLPLETGVNYTLVMKYKGKITDNLGGLYKTSYKKNNTTIWIAHTILKPSYARTVFPCFDEPNLKSRFEISVARLTNMSVVSNMQLKDTYPEVNSPGWVWDHFEISPYMAPHSVGFAILGFEHVKSQTSVPLPLIKLWGRKEVTDKAKYILKIAPNIIKSYNTLFDYNYSLHKIDLVAVPNLPVASISSWGLIFLRESDVLVTEFSSHEDKEKLLDMLSREIAKQWFGHVISLHSWIDSWLIETIASYSHYIAMNTIEPSWNLIDKTSLLDALEILDVDSMGILPKITAISSNIEGQDAQQALLYKKGGLIMRSINEILNGTELEKGIQNFVAKWKYNSFKAENIWKELSNATFDKNITVKEIINKWTTQEGYPLITATRNYESNKITILQSKFSDMNSTNNNAHWPLQLSYISSSSKDTNYEWIVNTSPKVIENAVNKEENSWIFFNLNRTSLCRVNYDLNNWNSLILVLKSKPDELSPANRAQLLDDAFHLARSGILNYTVALDMSLYLKEQEAHILPWTVMLKNLEYLNLLFSKTLYYGNFQDYVLKLIEPQFNKLKTNVDDKSYDVANLRKLIFKWACKFNYKPCKDWAYSQYETWESTSDNIKNPVDSDLQSIVYCVGVQNLGRKAWEFLWKKYSKQGNTSDEINALISGMSCATESWLTLKYLHRALDEENIQHSVAIWNALSSETTIDVAFEFFKDNWNKILKKYNPLALKQILSTLLDQLSTQYDLDQVTNFYSKYKSDLQNYAYDILAIIKKLQLKLNWKEKYLNDFNSWIELTNV